MKELENWLVLLLNNFYDGNPTQMVNIEQVSFGGVIILGTEENWRTETWEVCFEESFAFGKEKVQRFVGLVFRLKENDEAERRGIIAK